MNLIVGKLQKSKNGGKRSSDKKRQIKTDCVEFNKNMSRKIPKAVKNNSNKIAINNACPELGAL